MRLAVLSDIHGNLTALEAMLSDLRQYAVNGILVAGDIVVGGPQPAETLQRLRALGCVMIRGNADQALLQHAAGRAPASQSTAQQFALLRWTRRQVDQDALDFLASLPEQRVVALAGADPIRMVHGSPRHISERIFPERDPALLDLVLAQISEPVLVCGHTHLPWQVARDGRLALNPGAVGSPLNGTLGAQYALLTWANTGWQARLIAVPYDLEPLRQVCRTSGFLADGGAFARLCLLSVETGQDVLDDFFAYAAGLTEQAGYAECDHIPDAVWKQAVETFGWAKYVRLG
jgi:putative phosphoesterase